MKPDLYREMAAVQGRHWWFVARRRIIASVISDLSLPPSAEIVEIGCGAGGNLAMLSAYGRLQAVEYDDEARALAESLGVCHVVAGNHHIELPVLVLVEGAQEPGLPPVHRPCFGRIVVGVNVLLVEQPDEHAGGY